MLRPGDVDVDAELVAARRHRRPDDDVAALGEPSGHQDDGRQRLDEPRGVGERLRHARLDLADDLHVHPHGELARVEHRGHHDVSDAGALGRDRELAGLDPRRVEDGVDEVEELEPALLDDRDALALPVAQRSRATRAPRSPGSR